MKRRRVVLILLTLLIMLTATTTTSTCFNCDSFGLECRNQAMQEYQECFDTWGYTNFGAAMCKDKAREACARCMFLKGCPMGTQCGTVN